MPGGRFAVELEARAAGDYAPHGMEQVEFEVSANPGQPPRPLAKVASGGELSRISLAIQVITARSVRVPSLIFDEVDVGVGGAIAELVGQQLRALGGSHQVLCVTHLPQVAALAHHHLKVSKQTRGGQTNTVITPLAETARCEEIARMLGGMEITRQTRAHAREMVEKAKEKA
jgi:DNA repair protein RecN (Recombination protein N)